MTTEQKLREALAEVTQLLKDGDTLGASLALSEVEKLIDALAQSPAPEQQAPQGWKLVPVEIDEKMVQAAGVECAPFKSEWEVAQELWDRLLSASPAAPEAAKPPKVTWPITEAEHQFHERHSGGAKPETERAALVNSLLSLLDDQTLGLEEDQEDIIKEAAALLSADSKAGGEPTCERCGEPPTRHTHEHWCENQSYAYPQQQAKPLSESQWEEIASLVGCVKITPRGRAAIMRVINTPDSDGIGKDQA